jgi:hypothetical protein
VVSTAMPTITANSSSSTTPAEAPMPATMMPTSPRGTMPTAMKHPFPALEPARADPRADQLAEIRQHGDRGEQQQRAAVRERVEVDAEADEREEETAERTRTAA